MTSLSRLIVAALIVTLVSLVAVAQNDMRLFISRSGDKLMEGSKEYRFISLNIPNLHLVEDNMSFEATNEWRFPDEFEIRDALLSVKQMGGRAARMYTLSICRKDGPNPIPCHVRQPGSFNEEAFRALDRVLDVANRTGVRVIIPLVDNWKWWGGIGEYAAYRNKQAEDFWADQGIIEDFKKTISFVINRRNTYNGTLYRDDKAILAWETGNELSCPYSWTKQIAAHIKSLDPNHLVWDGLYLGNREIQPEALADPNIDIVSSHHYPGANKPAAAMAENIANFHQQIAGKKVYIVGEIGFIPLADFERVFNAVISNHVSGALIWSLRFHNRDGGFYWHSEPAGDGIYKAYHYPGFATGRSYQELDLLKLLSAKAHEISSLSVSRSEIPAPPKLLPIKSAAEISWQGSVGASSYEVERATSASGRWEVVGADVEDTWVQYRSLFSDNRTEVGKSYYYRVRAKNNAGKSEPSNVLGPVKVEEYCTIDELIDYSHVFAQGGNLSFETANARQYKEDAHRLKGTADSWITYRTDLPLLSAKIFLFMEDAEKEFEVYLSRDGSDFVRAEAKVSRFPTEVNPYGYKLPVLYELAGLSPQNRYLKIVFRAAAQISRVELRQRK